MDGPEYKFNKTNTQITLAFNTKMRVLPLSFVVFGLWGTLKIHLGMFLTSSKDPTQVSSFEAYSTLEHTPTT